MKRTTLFVAILFLAVSNAFAQRSPTLTSDDVEAAKTPKSKSDAPASLPANTNLVWGEVAPAGSGFKVLMPGRPTTNTQSQDLPVFGKVEHHLFQAGDGDTVYQASYFQLPSSEAVDINKASFRQAFLSGVTQGLVKSLKGELVAEMTITHEGSEGREVQVKIPSGIVWSRVFLLNGKVYSLTVLSAQGESEKQRRFFASFTTK